MGWKRSLEALRRDHGRLTIAWRKSYTVREHGLHEGMYLDLARRSGIGQNLNKLKVAPETIERESEKFDQQHIPVSF